MKLKNKNPLVSVVIPAYNEEKDIGECLNSLTRQSYKQIEVIVIDDGSSDGTREIVKKFKKFKLMEGQHKGPGFSRNLGAKKARGEILVFVDADMVFPKNYVEKLTFPIRKGKTFGTEEEKQRALNLDNIWSKCWGSFAKENRGNLGHIFRAILKKEFIDRGGFDPKYGYADDMTLYFKYGLQSEVVKGVFCYHKNPDTLNGVYKQSRWIGASLPITWKIFSLPIVKQIITLLLYPLSILVIPLLTLYKTAVRKQFSILPQMFVFYCVRYFGTLEGICREIFKGINVR